MVRLDPRELDSPDARAFAEVFRLRRGTSEFRLTQEALSPFRAAQPADGLTHLDLETRSLLQALYYVSHGVEVPDAHRARGLVTITHDATGRDFDWQQVMGELFRVRSQPGTERPTNAHVAVNYKDHWFYVDEADQNSKSTFSLLVELSRLELTGKSGPGPQLTLPIGR